MDTIKNLLESTSLVVIGGTVDTARKAALNGFVNSFLPARHFNQDAYEYDWIMHWLSKQPALVRSREFEITIRSIERGGITQKAAGDNEDVEEEDGTLIHGRRKRRVSFQPSIDTTHTITRTNRYPDDTHGCDINISVVALSNDILKKFVLEAKREYEKDVEHKLHIFLSDTNRQRLWDGARQKRPMTSIILQPGVKGKRLSDCKDDLPNVPRPIPYDAVPGKLGHPHQGQSDGQAPQRPSIHYGHSKSLGEGLLKETHPSTATPLAHKEFRTQYQDHIDPWDSTDTAWVIKISEQPGFVNFGKITRKANLGRSVALWFINSPDADMEKSSAAEETIEREQTIKKRVEELKDRVRALEKKRGEIEKVEEEALHLAEELEQKAAELKKQEEELMKQEELFERREEESWLEERQQLIRQQARQGQYLPLPFLLLPFLFLPFLFFCAPSPSSFSSSSQRKDIYVYDTN